MATHWTLEDLYRGVMRSWWVLVATIGAMVIAAVGVFFVFPQNYTAEAQHTVEPISVLSSGSSFNTVNMETERVVATSTAVLERAVATLGDDASVKGLREATVIQVPRNSQVLVFEVTTRSPVRSAEWANALAVSYGEQRVENARTVVEQTNAELTSSIQALQAVVDRQPVGSSERAATQQQLQALLDQQARLTATPFFSGLLVTPAVEPSGSNRPSILVFVAAGLFLGMLVGGVAALIVSRARSSSASLYKRGKKAGVAGLGDTDFDAAAGSPSAAASDRSPGAGHTDASSQDEAGEGHAADQSGEADADDDADVRTPPSEPQDTVPDEGDGDEPLAEEAESDEVIDDDDGNDLDDVDDVDAIDDEDLDDSAVEDRAEPDADRADGDDVPGAEDRPKGAARGSKKGAPGPRPAREAAVSSPRKR